jgi:hypothetical protein
MGTRARLAIFLLVVAGAVYVGWNMIPPRFHNSQLQEDLDDIVRRVTYASAIGDDDIKKMVVAKAATEDIVLKEDQITIARGGMGLAISVHYRVHVDMIVYQTDLDFVANSRNKSITG